MLISYGGLYLAFLICDPCIKDLCDIWKNSSREYNKVPEKMESTNFIEDVQESSSKPSQSFLWSKNSSFQE